MFRSSLKRWAALVVFIGFAAISGVSFGQTLVAFPGRVAGLAQTQDSAGIYLLSNELLTARFVAVSGSFRLEQVEREETAFAGGVDLFRIVFTNGATLGSSQMIMQGAPAWQTLAADSAAARASERVAGKALQVVFRNAAQSIEVTWRAVLRNGSHYLRQECVVRSLEGNHSVKEIVALDGRMRGGRVEGYTDGSVLVGEGFFCGLESPLAKVEAGAIGEVGAWSPTQVATGVLTHNLGVVGPGELVLTYQYTSGNHRLDVDKAELLDGATVVATDGHNGYAGVPSSQNVYRLIAPARKNYVLRTTLNQTPGENNSNGKILLPVASASIAVGSWTPSQVAAKTLSYPVTFSEAGTYRFVFTSTGGSNALILTGAELRGAGNAVTSSDIHPGRAGSTTIRNSYDLKVPAAGSYTLVAQNDFPASNSNSSGSITAAKIEEVPVKATWPRNQTLVPGVGWSFSHVIGVMEPGQARRSFLAYVERERAHPYRHFVHYNSWYDLNIGRNDNSDPLKRMTEAQTLAVVDAWNEQLYTQRGVRLDGFVWDDGWDDFNSLWAFHIGFPNGFSVTDRRSRNQQAGTGAWLSPWGGYGGSQSQRVAYWNSTHDPDIGSFHMSNAEYYTAFRGRCQQMLQDYDMRYFKFDGIGAGTLATGPAAGNDADIDGLLRLLGDLRETRKDVFLNCTVGTWASPFWMRYCDSVWRQGEDASLEGQGDARQRWITYRDNMVYDRFALPSPFYPLNSLMFHGLIVGDRGIPAQMPRTLDGVRSEIRASMACGSGLQELYVTHGLMTSEMWDELAKGIRWLRANQDVLADVHWLGGDPSDGGTPMPYGWAAWNPRKATLALRNPGGTAQTYTLRLDRALELPAGAVSTFTCKAGYTDQPVVAGLTNEVLSASASVTITLQPYQVIVFDLWPQGAMIPENPLSSATVHAGSFGAWARGEGIAVADLPGLRLQDVFAQDFDGDGVPNGVAYALGLNEVTRSPLVMRMQNGQPIAEAFPQAPGTEDSVSSRVIASHEMEDWSAPIQAVLLPEKPQGVDWWRVSSPEQSDAFFRYEVQLK